MSIITRRFKGGSQLPGGREAAQEGRPIATTQMTVIGDNPIRRAEDDTLGRSSAARSFARQVLALDTKEGVVVGVLGAWGSGKTSFVNLARDDFNKAGVPVLDFNPWMFSGAEQLVESFFAELAAQLRLRKDLAEVGKSLEDYGEVFSGMAWLPLVGPWIERGRGVTRILAKILQHRKEGVGSRRSKLESALAGLDRPIVVVLDDIDRLSSSEIREMFKLVRLTASFPNIVYIVAFDRDRVEKALDEQGVPGRDYLEKILQVAVDLPAIPDHVLQTQIFSALDAALSGIENPGPFDDQVWPDVFAEIIRPLIRNMRDVRRYSVALLGTVEDLGGQIALADALSLEAIRIFLPDVFSQIHTAVDGLTATSAPTLGERSDPSHLNQQVNMLIKAGGMHESVVRAMIERLFPAAQRHIGGSHYGSEWKQQWLRERRVAHQDILRLYLERVPGEALLAFVEAEQAWKLMADLQLFERYMRSVDVETLQDVIGSLEAYEDDYKPEHVVPGSVVLLNLLPDIPNRSRSMFEVDTRLVVTRVVYRLLRSLPALEDVGKAVREILPQLTTLSSKLEVIDIVGYREGVGHKLVSEALAAELEMEWRAEVRSTVGRGDFNVEREHNFLRVIYWAKRYSDASETRLILPEDPKLTLALLRAARSDVVSQTLGSRAVRRDSRLAWDVLVEVFGDETTTGERLEELKAAGIAGSVDLLELAGRYLSGWRPSE